MTVFWCNVCGGLLGCTTHVEKHHLSLDPSVIPLPIWPLPPPQYSTKPLLTHTAPSLICSVWHWHSDKAWHSLISPASSLDNTLLYYMLRKHVSPSAFPNGSFPIPFLRSKESRLPLSILIYQSLQDLAEFFAINEAQNDWILKAFLLHCAKTCVFCVILH